MDFQTEKVILHFVTDTDLEEVARTWPADHHPLSETEAWDAVAYMRFPAYTEAVPKKTSLLLVSWRRGVWCSTAQKITVTRCSDLRQRRRPGDEKEADPHQRVPLRGQDGRRRKAL